MKLAPVEVCSIFRNLNKHYYSVGERERERRRRRRERKTK